MAHTHTHKRERISQNTQRAYGMWENSKKKERKREREKKKKKMRGSYNFGEKKRRKEIGGSKRTCGDYRMYE